MSKITIKEVKTRRELRKFVDFPNHLYRGNPNYVPAFYGDDLADWNKKKNPAFAYCDAKCFLAYRDGKLVGRIGAILSHKANETWGTSRMRFSQVDFIDDLDVSRALFEAAESWAREMGCTQIHGPLGFCDMDREGMLVDGYDRLGMFITYYNHPYYVKHLEALGYRKDTDWVEYRLQTPEPDTPIANLITRMSDRLIRQGKYHYADLRHRADYAPYVEKVFRLVNEAYAPLYGVVELNEEQIKKYAKKFVPLVNPDYACFILDAEDNLVAFGVSAPSLSRAMQTCRGRLLPFGFLSVLHDLKKNDTLDLFLVAVKPELQGGSLIAMIFSHFLKSAHKNGIRFAETGPQLETNQKIQAQWKFFDKEQHKRRRCFIKDLDE